MAKDDAAFLFIFIIRKYEMSNVSRKVGQHLQESEAVSAVKLNTI